MVADKFIQKLKELLEKPSSAPLSSENLGRLKGHMRRTDTRLEFVVALTTVLKERASTAPKEEWMKNILRVVGVIAAPENFVSEEDIFVDADHPDATKSREENYAEFKKRFSDLWREVMKWKMTPSVHKQVVVLLSDRIMVHLTKPLQVSHFLIESFTMGGSVALLSLHGIFILMQEHNFEVPDFYTRLYSMFTSEMLHSKYRSRFFAYSRDFLTSTHLPEYLVAAFVKKLSRLSLHAPLPALPLIFDFITNILLDHPGLKTLIHKNAKESKPGTVKQVGDTESGNQSMIVEEDPFVVEEKDPMKSRALESSLWEIKTLQSHCVPSIAVAAKFISKPLPKVNKDLEEALLLTYTDMCDKERTSSKSLEPIANHVPPKKFKFACRS